MLLGIYANDAPFFFFRAPFLAMDDQIAPVAYKRRIQEGKACPPGGYSLVLTS